MDDGYVSNSEIMKLLAERIKEYRLAARLSQKELSAKTGVGLATISHFEQGVSTNMTISNLISLMRAFGMEQRVAELLPKLPMHPRTLREINKLIPKRVRRNQNA
jgi:transcriptional regulator with XRE-family HTH domain